MQKQTIKAIQAQVSETAQLVDDSYRLDLSIKENKKVLDGHKKKLKALAIKEGKSSFSGEIGKVEFSNLTKTEIEPRDLYKLLVDIEQEDLFFDLVSVKVGAAKERIGDMLLGEIWKQTVIKNNTVKFKKGK